MAAGLQDRKARAASLVAALRTQYPEARCELDSGAPHELLIATILSAQATDAGVNRATPGLFAAFRTPADYAASTPEAIGERVRTVNFWRTKSKAIHQSMMRIVEVYGGVVPQTMEELLTLRGVARKTANVVLGECFKRSEGIVVDTHVLRLAARFRLSRHRDPLKVERDLMTLVRLEDWTILSHLLIWHGRRVCKARGGACASDPICRKFGSCARAAARSRPASAHSRAASSKAPAPRRTGSSRSSPSRKRA
ncbi:MAG: endonuclease III [Planctomycetota bacterium]|nr:endonuclease III [Planctomycetota bacterium]MDA1106090.1 endonuclease III [Planctomycetota bacterium]